MKSGVILAQEKRDKDVAMMAKGKSKELKELDLEEPMGHIDEMTPWQAPDELDVLLVNGEMKRILSTFDAQELSGNLDTSQLSVTTNYLTRKCLLRVRSNSKLGDKNELSGRN